MDETYIHTPYFQQRNTTTHNGNTRKTLRCHQTKRFGVATRLADRALRPRPSNRSACLSHDMTRHDVT